MGTEDQVMELSTHGQEEEVILYVQGQPIPSSQLTEDLLQQMTREEFEQYERLAEHQQGE